MADLALRRIGLNIVGLPGGGSVKSLKQLLFDEYGGFADKRIKNLEKGKIFIVDDRCPGDIGADRKLFSYFCMIFVEVESTTELRVSLVGNVPMSKAVRTWASKHGVELHGGLQPNLEFRVVRGKQEGLRQLGTAIRSIVAPGSPRYPVPNYKYVCPRTAGSLDRLAAILDSAWST